MMKLSEKTNGISTNINLIRFIAAILVIFSHSFYVAASQEDPFVRFCNGQANLGGIAVAVFFFLSGFYVTKSLYKKNDVREYFSKRCVRIFPQLWGVVLLSVFVLGPIFTTYSLGEYFTDGSTYLYLLNGVLLPVHNLPGVFVHNVYDATVNGALWTLPIEFVAYCAIAVIFIASKCVFKKEKMQKVFHIICVCVLFALFVFLEVVVQNDFLITVVRPLILFFVGVLYCDYAEKIKLNLTIAIFMILIMGISCKIGLLNYALIICFPYIIMTFALAIKQVKLHSKIWNISYEIYLFGWPIQQMVTSCFGGSMNPYWNCLITVPIDIAFAFVLYNIIEKIEKRG